MTVAKLETGPVATRHTRPNSALPVNGQASDATVTHWREAQSPCRRSCLGGVWRQCEVVAAGGQHVIALRVRDHLIGTIIEDPSAHSRRITSRHQFRSLELASGSGCGCGKVPLCGDRFQQPLFGQPLSIVHSIEKKTNEAHFGVIRKNTRRASFSRGDVPR